MSPFAARNWLKTIRGLIKNALATGLRKDDSTVGIKLGGSINLASSHYFRSHREGCVGDDSMRREPGFSMLTIG
jgi:hypothetical protein